MDTPVQLARAFAAGLVPTDTRGWSAVVAHTLHLTWEAALVAGAVAVVAGYIFQVQAAHVRRAGPESLRLRLNTLAEPEPVDERSRPMRRMRWATRLPGSSVLQDAGRAGRGLVALVLYGLALVAARLPSADRAGHAARAPYPYRGRVLAVAGADPLGRSAP